MIEWAINALAASTALMVLVLVLRGPVARAFGARAAYALWALPALRLVMPSLPSWPRICVPAWSVTPDGATIGLVPPATAATLATQTAPAATTAPSFYILNTCLPQALLMVWLGGAALWFGLQMARYFIFLAKATNSGRLLTRECGVNVLLSDHVDGPVAAGVIHRRIFLPSDFMDRYSADERRLALLHEGAHHDRGDIIANLAALAVLAIHWWNPIAHRAYRLFRADQELACDATVLADINDRQRHAYGSAIIKSASRGMPGVACALSHKDEIKQRLKTMAKPMASLSRRRAGIAVTLSAIGAGLFFTASGYATPADDPSAQEIPAIAAEARHEADLARKEALRDAAEARVEALRDAGEARNAALHEAADARREAAMNREEALREAAEARTEAASTREAALHEAAQMRLNADQVRRIAADAREAALRNIPQVHLTAAQTRAIAASVRSEAQQQAAQARQIAATARAEAMSGWHGAEAVSQ